MLLHKATSFITLMLVGGSLLYGQNGERYNHTQSDTLPPINRVQPLQPYPADSTIWIGEVTVDAFPVSGRLRTIPGSISVLTGREINLTDGNNLATSLNTIPGVTMQSGTFATGRIVIRGMGSRTPYNTNRIRAYLNEIPLTGSDGISSPEELDILSIGRMEIVKGPASALYGSGLGGSINLFTPLGQKTSGRTDVQYGAWQTANLRLSGSLQRDNSNHWGSVSHLQSDGYRENNSFRRTSLLSTARWRTKRWSISGTLLALDSRGGIPSSLSLDQFTKSPGSAAANWKAVKGYQQNSKVVTGLTISLSLTENITNQVTLFGKWDDNFERRPFNDLDDHSLSTGIRNKLTFHGHKADWVAGGEWITDQYGWKLIKDENLLNKNRENRSHFSFYSLVWYRPAEKWTITAAGAVSRTSYRLSDLFAENGDQSGERNFPLIFSPRLGLNYSPGEKMALFASLGHGYSLPSPEETLLPEGDVNRDIRPEQGYQYEAGTRLNLLGNRFGMEGTFYWIELNNLLVTKRITEDLFTGTNAGKTRHRGFELSMRNRFWSLPEFPGQLSSILSYSRSLNLFVDFINDGVEYDGNHLPGIPDQTIQYQVIWQPVNKLEGVIHLSHTGNQYLNDGNTGQADGYFLVNAKLTGSLRIGKSGVIKAYAGINNLTDARYASMIVVNAVGFSGSQPRYYYPGLPRNGYAGISYQF